MVAHLPSIATPLLDRIILIVRLNLSDFDASKLHLFILMNFCFWFFFVVVVADFGVSKLHFPLLMNWWPQCYLTICIYILQRFFIADFDASKLLFSVIMNWQPKYCLINLYIYLESNYLNISRKVIHVMRFWYRVCDILQLLPKSAFLQTTTSVLTIVSIFQI